MVPHEDKICIIKPFCCIAFHNCCRFSTIYNHPLHPTHDIYTYRDPKNTIFKRRDKKKVTFVSCMERTALFPGSFDPFTLGHMAVAERGLEMFDRLVVGIGVNSSKQGLFAPEQRAEIIRAAFAGNPRVEVAVYGGLTGDFCRSRGIRHVLRGLRNSTDFEYEHDMEMALAQIFPEITTVAVFTPAEFIPVSSRLVREIITMGGDPAKFLPHNIDIKKYL
jgi:pantetheine-phosphate adenylyltransferase